MTTDTDTVTVPPRVQAFVDEVATHFSDLDERERADLLDDLTQHLTELAADDPETLQHELRSAAAYAAELRRSAGLPEPARTQGRIRRLRGGLRAYWERIATHPRVEPVVEFLPQLRPAWWVLRAWVLVTLLAMMSSGGPPWRHVPIPGRTLLGMIAVVAAIVVSVRWGSQGRDRTRPWSLADAGLGVAAVWLVVAAMGASPVVYEYVDYHEAVEEMPVLRHPDGEPITNLYLYDADGNPLSDVLVVDGRGRPVEIGQLDAIGFEDIETDYARDASGRPLTSRYPLEQYTVEYGPDGTPTRRPRRAPEVIGAPTTIDEGSEPSPSKSPAPSAEPEASESPTGPEQATPTASPTSPASPTPAASPDGG